MKKVMLGLLCLTNLVFSTSAAESLSENERSVEFVEKTDVPKLRAYQGAMAWLVKSSEHTKKSVQSDDSASGSFISNEQLKTCPGLRKGDTKIIFLIDFQAKDNRVKISFEKIFVIGRDTVFSSRNGIQNIKAYPFTKDDLESLKEECFSQLKDEILISIKKQAKEW